MKRGRGWQGRPGRQGRRATAAGATGAGPASAAAGGPASRAGGGSQRRRGRPCQRARGQRALCGWLRPQQGPQTAGASAAAAAPAAAPASRGGGGRQRGPGLRGRRGLRAAATGVAEATKAAAGAVMAGAVGGAAAATGAAGAAGSSGSRSCALRRVPIDTVTAPMSMLQDRGLGCVWTVLFVVSDGWCLCLEHIRRSRVSLRVVWRAGTTALAGGSLSFDWLSWFHIEGSHQCHVKLRAPDSFTI